MELEQFAAALESITSYVDRRETLIDSFGQLCTTDSEFHIDVADEMMYSYIMLLSELTGISDTAITWFIVDNEYGDKELTVTDKDTGESVVIDSVEAFWKFEKGL